MTMRHFKADLSYKVTAIQKELARHRDVNMTMKYTLVGLNGQAKAVANLPAPKRDAGEPAARSALHGRCIFGGAARLSVSSNGKVATNEKRQSPCRDKDFGVDRRRLSPDGKMEAAGIEPASRNISTPASTCVADSFPLSPSRPLSTGCISGQPGTVF
jgi:hypothetical protein